MLIRVLAQESNLYNSLIPINVRLEPEDGELSKETGNRGKIDNLALLNIKNITLKAPLKLK